MLMAVIFAVGLYNLYVFSNDAENCLAIGAGIGGGLTRIKYSKSINQRIERIFLLVFGSVVGSTVEKVRNAFHEYGSLFCV